MNFLDLAKERYSVRKFSDKKIENEKLEKILEAAKLAPTACNFQPQRLLILSNQENLEKLKQCTPYHFDAPLAIIICYDKTASWKRKYDGHDSGEVDASIVTTQMMLEIAELGLGTTWVGSYNPELLKQLFNIPNNYVSVAILPIGYPDSEPHANHDNRLKLSKIAFYNSF